MPINTPSEFYNPHIEQFYTLFQGVLVFQALFLLTLYFSTNRKDILYYAFFLIFSAAYFYLNAPFTFFGLNEDAFFETNLYVNSNIPLIILCNVFYILFIKSFFVGSYQNKSIETFTRIVLLSSVLLIGIFFLLLFLQKDTQPVFYIINFLSASVSLYYIIAVFKYRTLYSGWVAWGMIFNIVGLSITILLIVLERRGMHNVLTFSYPLLFMRIGILIDIFFYQTALLKKWNWQEKQLAIEKVNAQLAIEKFRNKISRELHDDLGATLSGVSMYSHLIQTQLETDDLAGAEKSLNIMKETSTQMVNRLNDMIWLTKPQKYNVAELIQRLEEYAGNITKARNMQLRFSNNIQQLHSLSFEEKHNIYLFCKEAINNAVKYSEGTVLQFIIKESEDDITYIIHDNGKGFNTDNITNGNGLTNMRQRAEEIGAECSIHSTTMKGSTITLTVRSKKIKSPIEV